jgi:hypothetical protein
MCCGQWEKNIVPHFIALLWHLNNENFYSRQQVLEFEAGTLRIRARRRRVVSNCSVLWT